MGDVAIKIKSDRARVRSYIPRLAAGLLKRRVALVQLVRALAGFPVQIGPYPVPMAASWLIAIVSGALAFWGLRLLRHA